MALVRPVHAFQSTAAEFPVVLSTSDILDSDDVHVRAHPDLFVPLTVTVRGAVSNVEQATASPGEKRKAR